MTGAEVLDVSRDAIWTIVKVSSPLLVVGHGGSHPVVSNATEAGRARNRRIEIVVYPESMRR